MDDKLYIKKFIRDDGEKLSFDGEQLYLAQENTLLVRPDPSTTAVNFTEADGGEMIHQQNTIYDQPVNGLIIPKSTDYWTLTKQLSLFFKVNHTYKIVYIKKDGSMFAVSNAWISSGLQIVPVPHEEYSEWSITMTIGNVNWTEYAEDSQGNEIYSNTITLPLLSAATGGEEWEHQEQEAVSGEGSKIELDTDFGATVTDLDIKGDTFQQTYSGKNLIVFAPSTNSSAGVDWTITNNTISGSGTGTSNWSVITNYISFNSPLPAGQYTFSIPEALTKSFQLNIKDADNTVHDYTISAGNKKITFTTTFVSSSYRLAYRTDSSAVSVSMPNQLQLESGSTATTYEPYTAGPAPNPDYPQKVQTVTGEQTIWVSGRNLFNGELALGIINGTTGKNGSNSNYVRCKDYIPVEEATKYTISSTNSSITTIFVYEYTADFAYNLTSNRSVANGGSFTTNSGTKYIRFRPNIQSSDTSIKFQLEKGIEATSYYPYLAKSYEVNLGKNLIPMSTASVSDSQRINRFNIDLPAGTYTMSFNIDSFSLGANTSFGINMGLYDSSNTVIFDNSIFTISSSTTPGRKTFTFTTTANASASSANSNIRVGQTLYDNGARVELSDIQIEAGERDTDYAPYFTPIELCKIDNYQDYIYKSGDDWYVHKEVGKIMLDGTEATWAFESTYSSFFVDISDLLRPPSRIVMVLSDNFAPGNASTALTQWANYPNNTIAARRYDPNQKIGIKTDAANSLADFKTWLGTHNTTVYYALATPTDTKITDSDLIDQLDALYTMQGYSEKTIITVSTVSTNQPAILAVTLQNPPITGEVWDEVGTVWELGSGGPQTINIDSTTTVYPVWVVQGPCINPTLQNNTTDTLAQYDGTVAAGQTLTVDFAEGTAHLDSALVARYISGLVSLRPGDNTLGFNSDGGTTEISTISWNNVIN